MELNDKVDLFGKKVSVATILIVTFVILALLTYAHGETKNRERAINTIEEGIEEGAVNYRDHYLRTMKDLYNDGEINSNNDSNNDSNKKTTNDGEKKEETFYKITQPFDNPYAELEKLIGLGSVKSEVRSMINYIKVQNARKKEGLATKDVAYHMVFTGNPGTGKTTVARIMASIFKDLGVLKKGHTVETDRSGLVGEYVGQTGPKTNKVVDAAIHGVLFVDEAYTLYSPGNSYGQEAIATLLKRMEDDRDSLVVIIAGYNGEMQELLEMNPGLKSRFNRYIDFPDYSSNDLCAIFSSFAKSGGYILDSDAERLLKQRMDEAVAHRDKYFGNGRFARNVFERAIIIQADRLEQMGGADNMTKQQLQTITQSDLMEAFRVVKK